MKRTARYRTPLLVLATLMAELTTFAGGSVHLAPDPPMTRPTEF